MIERLNDDDPEANPDISQDKKADKSEGYDGIVDGCTIRVMVNNMVKLRRYLLCA